MPLYSKTRVLILAMTPLFAAKNMSTPIGPQLVIHREEVIDVCEKRFRGVLANFARIGTLKKPKKKASAHDKAIYNNKQVVIKAFLTSMKDLLNISNNKGVMRAASSAEELIALSNAYSSNCARFALSLNEFIHWVLGEKLMGNKNEIAVKQRIFQEWIDEAQN